MAKISMTFVVDVDLRGYAFVHLKSAIADSVVISDTPNGDGIQGLGDTITMSDGGEGVINFVQSEKFSLNDQVDARVRGALQTLFITDERFLDNIIPKKIRENEHETEGEKPISSKSAFERTND